MEIKIKDIEIYLYKNSIQKKLKFPVASYVLTGFVFILQTLTPATMNKPSNNPNKNIM